MPGKSVLEKGFRRHDPIDLRRWWERQECATGPHEVHESEPRMLDLRLPFHLRF